jgi:triacylglycerol lipase
MQLRTLLAGSLLMLTCAFDLLGAEPESPAAVSAANAGVTAPLRDTVVLLHGMGRTKFSMLRLASALRRDGYHVINVSYPSRTASIESLAGEWLPQQLRAAGASEGQRVHFVTHSLGGIMVRLWLRDYAGTTRVGRVVMLAPPNAGSELTDALTSFPPYRWATGVNGARLGTKPGSLPTTLGNWPQARAELGVIAGDCSLNPLLGAFLPRPNDGKVSVAATHLPGERNHLVLHHSHTWLAWRADTIAQTRAFLRDGAFQSTN